MSRLFETHLVTISRNELTKVDRQPINKLTPLVSGIKCRITGTNNDNIKIFILKRNYMLIPNGLHKNDQITVEGDFVQKYLIEKEPIWAGGTTHHIETTLIEAK